MSTREGLVRYGLLHGEETTRAVAELERLKEEVGHLKLWEGVAVVIVTGLAGWLVSTAENAAPVSFALAVACVLLMGIGILRLYRQIVRRIDKIGEL